MVVASQTRGQRERATYHHGALRPALVRAGLDLARGGGAEAIVLREATRRVGVSARAAYRHFADREALVQAVAQEALAEMAGWMTRRQRGAATAAELLQGVGEGYIAFALDEPGWFDVAVLAMPDLLSAGVTGPGPVVSKAMGPGAAGSGAMGPGAAGSGAMGPGAAGSGAMGPGAARSSAAGSGALGPSANESINGISALGGDRSPCGLLLAALAGLVREGFLAPDRVVEAAVTCWSGVHGFAVLATQGPLSRSPRATIDAFARGHVATLVAAVTS